MARERWKLQRTLFEVDQRGVGRAVYTVEGPERSYSLVAFGHDLPPDQRTDRVIAQAWDTTFVLFDGQPDEGDLERLARNTPLQEAGRFTDRELTLSRANRSARIFEHTVERLASGKQPDPALVDEVGYLMRTTAVYGSGKFGLADRAAIADRPELAAPFQAEMLTVYLIRTFVSDLVDSMAAARAPETAVPLARETRRRLGIGNSTGLGMAPFLINHPVLLHHWIAAREEGLARVRRQRRVRPEAAACFLEHLAAAQRSVSRDRSTHPLQIARNADLRSDLAKISETAPAILNDPQDYPWDRLWRWGNRHLSEEGQERLLALMLEPHPELVDDLAEALSADEMAAQPIDGSMTLQSLRSTLSRVYAPWALDTDWSDPRETARAWYVSAEKKEPRLGERRREPIEPYELPLGAGRDAARLSSAIADLPNDQSVADFLQQNPQFRGAVRRAQIAARYAYAELRDNTLAAGMMPIEMLRLKLAFFGATGFDPRSDRWVRIALFDHAPLPDELAVKGDGQLDHLAGRVARAQYETEPEAAAN